MTTRTVAPLEDYVSLSEGALRYRIHPRTIRRAIARGELTGYRVGGHALRVSVAELESWATARPIPSAAGRAG